MTAPTPGEVIATRLREARESRRWTQEELAGVIRSRFGVRFDRATIAKIEGGGTRARNLSVEDLLLLAAALGVSPLNLMLPLSDDATVAVAPGVELEAATARQWARGYQPLRGKDSGFYYFQAPERDAMPDAWAQRLIELIDERNREAEQ